MSLRLVRAVLLLAVLATLSGVAAQQGAPQQHADGGPLDRLELLGLIAGGADLKFVLQQATQRGVTFVPDEDFWNAVGPSTSTEWLAVRLRGLKPVRQSPDPKRDAAYERLSQGIRLRKERQFGAAEMKYRGALDLEPQSAVLHAALGLLLSIEQKYDGAIPEYREAIRLWPSYSSAHAMLGAALQAQRQFHDAKAEFEAALRLDPNERSAKIGLAMTLVSLGKYQEAVPRLREVMHHAAQMPILHRYYGTALLWTGDLAAGIRELNEYLGIEPNDADARVFLSAAYDKTGNKEAAREQCDKALHLAPNRSDLRQSCEFIAGKRKN